VVVRRALARRGQLCQEHWSRQVQIINEAIGAIKDLKIMRRETHLMKLFDREVSGNQGHEAFYLFVSGLPKLFLEVVAVSALLFSGAALVILGRPAQSMLPVMALLGVAIVRLIPATIFMNIALTDIRYKRPAFDLVCEELKNLETPIADQDRTVTIEMRPDGL